MSKTDDAIKALTFAIQNAEKLRDELCDDKIEEWPKCGDKYCYIFSTGEVEHETWRNNEWDRDRLQIDNVFRTEQGAIDCVRRCKINTALQNLADKMWRDDKCVLDWDNERQVKKEILLDHENGLFGVNETCLQCQGAVYFPDCTLSDITDVVPEKDIRFLMGVK